MEAQKLNVTIVGAGLAGLFSARVLRAYHTVTVLERSSGSHEVGAAIALGPTATRIVERYGFERRRMGALVCEGSRIFNKHGELHKPVDLRPYATNTHADLLLNHRVDLWYEFLRLATAPSDELGIDGEPANVRFGADVVDVDVETGEVKLADGESIASDLVIGADGIRSRVRPLIVGQDHLRTARPSGTSAFRFTMPADNVLSIHPTIDIFDRLETVTIDIFLAMDGTKRSIVTYPVRDSKLVNFVCIAPDKLINVQTTESWTAAGSREDLLRCFGDYCPFITKLLEKAENIMLWQLRDQDPLPTYVKGRTAIIGDSAHAMTPHQGQGGTQSVEDAEGLSLFNKPGINRASVPAILQDFDSVRRPRASRIQVITREGHGRENADTIYKHGLYNATYPGIQVCLSRLKSGEEMIVL